MAQAMMYY
jgi:hypothetical protein